MTRGRWLVKLLRLAREIGTCLRHKFAEDGAALQLQFDDDTKIMVLFHYHVVELGDPDDREGQAGLFAEVAGPSLGLSLTAPDVDDGMCGPL